MVYAAICLGTAVCGTRCERRICYNQPPSIIPTSLTLLQTSAICLTRFAMRCPVPTWGLVRWASGCEGVDWRYAALSP
eukprot:2899285-Rhodomonas_salina.3